MPDASSPPLVRVSGVRKAFGGATVLDGVDLDVERGEFLSFLGPSGCGKTTLLRIVSGLEQPDAGRVHLDGADITDLPPNKRPLNMVFQRYALFPHLTVNENVGFGLALRKRGKAEIARRVAEMLDLVQLGHLGDRYPDQISGGQAQRVALARALANDPEVLLLDEPLAALDRAVRGDLQEQLKRIQREVGTTFVYVTHDQEEAMAMSSRIALMHGGRIRQLATPAELYRRPADSFAAGFVGDANVLDCSVAAGRLVWQGVELGDCPARTGSAPELRVMVRPEEVRLTARDGAAAIRGRLVASTYHGFYWMHRVAVGEQTLAAREIASTPVAALGETVSVSVDLAGAVPLED
ncbi:ABC transporter ATP-binding protein [Conexibacter arvalis]|uniref:ABC-type Fe3+/spermidine/putrescine transport system ATPase subunit n=1 Tax=Conexibacter arvalis TaxID=912552 RepID=A0A840IKB4_9ACTN|nr:ABC transporter ATP-binding protein [Conexibacter arvalis]MBB4664368.1 ABC-type Fe3+/spermidine/putrescine transport system ATPase subunit [Conexibacter arvalis]